MTSDVSGSSAAKSAIESLGVLQEDLRRRMFLFIRRARHPVTRDEAAASVGISRKLAAFHLDKLVDAGLLRARYAAPGGVPKVGRQPKVYEPSEAQIQVSVPERRHELLADLLLTAVLGERQDESAIQAALRTAAEQGRRLGEQERSRSRPGRLGAERGLTLCERMLEGHGYEPVRESATRLTLRNCPFHPLAAKAPDLVCGMNHAFLAGYLDGLDAGAVQAVLAPRPDECCVELRRADTASAAQPDAEDE
ncbi:helix-turn-helix transcriptional regulator [Actinomadura verrucosospora]|uniref:Transcriptional regulator n=1 Tax=Actinomadura verrucosospora TaxID=46165 RepID=A0A7D4A2R6_ACTVE|nr:transcriptional regulator [Actinomadura verrucosospora]QKG18787.1 transcriptional regulator [Actinomadura verrucosospora]